MRCSTIAEYTQKLKPAREKSATSRERSGKSSPRTPPDVASTQILRISRFPDQSLDLLGDGDLLLSQTRRVGSDLQSSELERDRFEMLPRFRRERFGDSFRAKYFFPLKK